MCQVSVETFAWLVCFCSCRRLCTKSCLSYSLAATLNWMCSWLQVLLSVWHWSPSSSFSCWFCKSSFSITCNRPTTIQFNILSFLCMLMHHLIFRPCLQVSFLQSIHPRVWLVFVLGGWISRCHLHLAKWTQMHMKTVSYFLQEITTWTSGCNCQLPGGADFLWDSLCHWNWSRGQGWMFCWYTHVSIGPPCVMRVCLGYMQNNGSSDAFLLHRSVCLVCDWPLQSSPHERASSGWQI